MQTPSETYNSPRHKYEVYRHGIEKLPVVVIDNYLDNPMALIEMAANGPQFEPNGPYYPGIRAPFPERELPVFLQALGPILSQCFDYDGRASVRECSFSLVTTKPEDLMPIQRLPHFDSLEEGRVAALLFLGQGSDNGGTAFYRHRSTGFESIDADRFPQFEAALNADVAQHGLPPQNYIGDDNPMYETLAVHAGTFNRMLVYPSATLHSGRIEPNFTFDPDPKKGRLTVNAFLGPET